MARLPIPATTLAALAAACLLATLAPPAAQAVPALEKLSRREQSLGERPLDGDVAHGLQYDHEAFLGVEEARTFDQLTPDESRHRLGNIVGRVDSNGDGFVTGAELRAWIEHTHTRHAGERAGQRHREYDVNGDGLVSWQEYRNTSYGNTLDPEGAALFHVQEGDLATYRHMLQRDERRFRVADRDGDMAATVEELTAFMHPEDFTHMESVVVMETMEDLDKDGDGAISLDEYIGDIMGRGGEALSPGEPEPEWVQTERHQFTDFRDTDRDGKLSYDEVRRWVLPPPDYNHAEAEARHLVYETDRNRDGKLTKEEILEAWSLFVGSQATNYGEDLNKHHDEL
ncbi:reticulocalbin-1-like [Lampetra fluviatilis]